MIKTLIKKKLKPSEFTDDILECKICFIDEINNILYDVSIPDNVSTQINNHIISSCEDIKKIPKIAGNYWIITNEPIRHCFNSGEKNPKMLKNTFCIVYNGTTTNLY